MRLRCCSFEKMADEIIKSDRKIIMFGAGVVGLVTVPQILHQYRLDAYIDCFLDNDSAKWKSIIEIGARRCKVHPVEYLKKCDADSVIFINISRYSEVLRQLEALECTRDMIYYIMPMMCICNFCMEESDGKAVLTENPLIPRKIHYMWLGGKEIPYNLQRCIESWKRFCPNYEIIRWDENNYDISKHEYMEQAYQMKAYGFVPDYARLDILYEHGGIYMDTDVEMVRNLDPLLYQEAFCGVEKWQILNFGGCSGAVKGNPMILKFLKGREHIKFLKPDGSRNMNTCGYYDTNIALQNGYQINGKTQNIAGMNIYAFDYFHPYDYMSGVTTKTNNTYSIHRFNGGWLDENMKKANEKAAAEYNSIFGECMKNNES